MEKNKLIENIDKLRKEKNAVILAHYYQIPEIQDIADYVGDSLGLANIASTTDAEVIVFAGVHFMAETAKIINPNKKVLLPDMEAGCSLADSAPEKAFRDFVESYPDHTVISYINCSAAVKTMTDIVVTSGNAVQIVNSLPKEEKIIFAPDKNLGAYINGVTGRDMILWNGTCIVHDQLTAENALRLKMQHPEAKMLAHPECTAPVLAAADYIGSTAGILNFAKKDDSNKFIIASETGLLHQLQQDSPDKEFIVLPIDETCACNDCPYMKKNTLQKLHDCMQNEYPEIILDDNVIEKARKPIDKMLDLSRKLNII